MTKNNAPRITESQLRRWAVPGSFLIDNDSTAFATFNLEVLAERLNEWMKPTTAPEEILPNKRFWELREIAKKFERDSKEHKTKVWKAPGKVSNVRRTLQSEQSCLDGEAS